MAGSGMTIYKIASHVNLTVRENFSLSSVVWVLRNDDSMELVSVSQQQKL